MSMADFRTPPPVESGDLVAVIAPSSGGAASARHILKLGCKRLKTHFDLRPMIQPTARQSNEYLQQHPKARAATIHEAFKDPEITAVIATIGGSDQLRVLRHLRPETLRAHPTRFFGMSDNTNLALYLWNHGIVSFNGGQLMNQIAAPGPLHEYTQRYLERALFNEGVGALRPAREWADLTIGWGEADYATADPEYREQDGWIWCGDNQRVTGRIWGGCLAIIEWQLRTGRYLPDPRKLDGAILAIETAEDIPSPNRVRWALMCLGERDWLSRFDGVLVGRPATQNWREERTWEERHAYREAQRDVIRDQLARYNPDVPIVFDVDFGHTNPSIPLPIGGCAQIDPGEELIQFS